MKMDSRMPTSICIATPAYGDDCKTGYVESLLKTCLQLRELSIGISFVTVSSALIALGRNLAVDFFIKQTNATHLLFVDADLRWRVNDLVRMLSFSERDVLAAVCPRRAYDWEKIAKTARENAALAAETLPVYGVQQILPNIKAGEEPLESEVAGTGIMLIRREVFSDLSRAHPDWLAEGGPHRGQVAYFSGGRTKNGFEGEDVSFCREVREIGKKVFVCPWFRIGHIGNHEFVGDPSLTHRE